MNVQMSSGLSTETAPGKQTTTFPPIVTTTTLVSRSTLSHSLLRQEYSHLLKTTEKTSISSGAQFSRFYELKSGGLSVHGGVSSKEFIPNIAPSRSIDDSRTKMFNSIVTVSPQFTAKTGESVRAKVFVISSPGKTGTGTKELQQTRILTSVRDNGKSPKTYLQLIAQSQYVMTTSVTTSKLRQPLSIPKGSYASIHSGGAKQLFSTTGNATAESLKGNYLNRSGVMITSESAQSTSHMVKNSNGKSVSSTKIIFSWSQSITQVHQFLSLSPRHSRGQRSLKTSIPGSSTSLVKWSQFTLLSSLIPTSIIEASFHTEDRSSSLRQDLSTTAFFPYLLTTRSEMSATIRKTHATKHTTSATVSSHLHVISNEVTEGDRSTTIRKIHATKHTVVASATVSSPLYAIANKNVTEASGYLPLLHLPKESSGTMKKILASKRTTGSSSTVSPRTTTSTTITEAWKSDGGNGKTSFTGRVTMSSLNTLILSPNFTGNNVLTIKDSVSKQTPLKSSALLLSMTHLPTNTTSTCSKLNTRLGTLSHAFLTKATVTRSRSMQVSVFSRLASSLQLVSKVSSQRKHRIPTTITSDAPFRYTNSDLNSHTLSTWTISYIHSNLERPGTVTPHATSATSSTSGKTSAILQASQPSSTITIHFRVTRIRPTAVPTPSHHKTTKSIKDSRSSQQRPSSSPARRLVTPFSYTLGEGSGDTPKPSTTKRIVMNVTVIPSYGRFISASNINSRHTTLQLVTYEPLALRSSFVQRNSKGMVQENQLLTYQRPKSVYNTSFHYAFLTIHVRSLNGSRSSMSTSPPVAISTKLNTSVVQSTLINDSFRRSSRISINSSLPTLSTQFYPFSVNFSAVGTLASKYSSIQFLQVSHSRHNTILYPTILAQTTIIPAMTTNYSTPTKVMDGSLIIKDKRYHTNLSNPNTTMFKTLADMFETIIIDIISLNNTDVLGVEVTCFKNGSVVAYFALTVKYDSPFNDQEFANLLREANDTLWRGYHVTNITVTLRTVEEGSHGYSHDQGEAKVSTPTIIAILAVLAVFLVAVGGFGVYVCKKKGLCPKSRVKPVK